MIIELKIQILLKIIKIFIIKKIFNDDEKYLIIRAIEDRVYNLERIAIKDKWVDYDNIQHDISSCNELRYYFSTKDYN